MSHHKYTLKMVPIGKLIVDSEYQRDFSEQYAKSLAAMWSWDECLPLVGSLRADGMIYLIDGQHRFGALQVQGYEGTVPILTYSKLTRTEEANLFLAYNSTKTVQAVDKHRARVQAGNKVAVSIENVLLVRQLRIGKGPYTRCIAAASACYKVTNRYGIDALAQTLDAIDAVYNGDEPSVFQAPLIEGIGGIYALASSLFDNEKFLKLLARQSIEEWTVAAREEVGSRGALGDGLKRVLVRKYNRGLALDKKI